MTRPGVYILCGRIASGKTTYANMLRERGNTVVLSCDRLMLTIFDNCLGEKHDDYEEKCKRYLRGLACEIVRAGCDAVLDAAFWKKSERDDFKEFFTAKGITAELHYLKMDEVRRLKLLKERNKTLEKHVSTLSGQGVSPSREYIISDELREYLDAKFEEPGDDADVVITDF